MGVQWDAVLTRGVAKELNALLGGARLRAYAFDPDHRRVTLFTDEGCLEWRLHPNEGHVRLFPARPAFDGATTLKAKIVGVSAPLDERRIEISIRRAKGSEPHLILHILLSTNQRNAILVNQLGVAEKVLQPRSKGEHVLQVGHPYAPPSPSAREGADAPLDRSLWEDLIKTEAGAEQLARVAWTSSLNVDALGQALDPLELWKQLAGDGAQAPGVVALPRGGNPYPVALPGLAHTPTSSLLEAFALCEGAQEAPLDPELESRLSDARQRADRRLQSLRRELVDSEDPEHLRSLGDLLLARLHTVPKGVAAVTLEGFDGAPVELTLDSKHSPRENADAFYDRAGRAKRARQDLPARISEATDRVADLDEALAALGRGEILAPDLVERLPRPGKLNASGAGPALPYRVYVSSSGLEIWVGRGSKSNDSLTFQHAGPNDVWLHARDAAGAHVVLRWSRDDAPPPRDLEEAALLAAQHSKARHSSWVPVDWTRRKHVRKPRKAAAGAVIPSRVKTVFVEPDEAKADAMAVRD